jgi:hypothetical protein
MTDLMEKALATIKGWSAAQQEEAALILLALDRLGPEAYPASDAELQAVDEALAELESGQLASESDVDAAFSRFRK